MAITVSALKFDDVLTDEDSDRNKEERTVSQNLFHALMIRNNSNGRHLLADIYASHAQSKPHQRLFDIDDHNAYDARMTATIIPFPIERCRPAEPVEPVDENPWTGFKWWEVEFLDVKHNDFDTTSFIADTADEAVEKCRAFYHGYKRIRITSVTLSKS